MEYVVYFVITIGILVFIHELGHFAAAKLSGMRADVFAIGFGKRLFGWNKITGFTFGDLPKDFDGQGNTDYRISLLPLGGYVKIAGMVDESMDTSFADKEPQPYEFRAKSTPKKIFVISAGVLMNLLLAYAIFWSANFFQGDQVIKTTTIAYVEPNSIADSLGLKANDKILAVNGVEVNTWGKLNSEIFINNLGEDVTLKIQRNGSIINLEVPHVNVPEDNEKPLLIPKGIRPMVDSVLAGLPADKAGFKAGDILLQINDDYLFSPEQATQIISGHPGEELNAKVLRNSDTLALTVTPGDDAKIGIIIAPNVTVPIEYIKYGFFESFGMAVDDIVYFTELNYDMVKKVISGNVEFGKAFGGPIKIAQFAAKSADTGIGNFIFFLALLSLTLAIINILPLPVLDGGHLVMIIIEGITKREIPVKIKIAIQNVGLIIFLLLFAFIVYNDIINW